MGREVLPSGFAIVAALRAFVLKLAAAEVDLSALAGPGGVFGCGHDVGYGRMDEPCHKGGRRQSVRTGKCPETRGVIERTTRGQRVCLGIDLIHGRPVTRDARTSGT